MCPLIYSALKATIGAALCGSALFVNSGLLAQAQSPGESSELVVVASRVAREQQTLATAVTLLDEAHITESGYLLLSDLLARQPGINRSRNGGPGSTEALQVRGEEGYRTLTVLDGIRISDPSAPQIMPQMEHLSSAGVQRVEILRGPQGLAWGADAGGVIRIETLPPPGGAGGASGMMHLSGGSYGTASADAAVSLGSDRVAASLSASHLESAGYNQTQADTGGERDGYRNDTFHGSVRAGVGQGLQLSWSGHLVNADTDYDACFGQVLTNSCMAAYRQQAHRIGLNLDSEPGSHSLSWQTVATDRDYFAGSDTPAFETAGLLSRVEYAGNAAVGSGGMLVWGVDRERAGNDTFERKSTGVYAEYIHQFDSNLNLSLGVRRDHSKAYGQHDSWRTGLAWVQSVGQGVLKWRASAGTGFRAPSPFELEYNQGPFAMPPASGAGLDAEYSRGAEAGVDYIEDRLRVEFTLFTQQVIDAISFDDAGFSGYLQSEGVSRSKGAELAINYAFHDNWQVSGSYTRNEAVRPDGQRRLRRPRDLLNLYIQYGSGAGPVKARLTTRFVGDRPDVGNASLEDFQVWDARLSWQSTAGKVIYIQVENILDERYEELAGYIPPGRTLRAGIRYGWQ